MSLHLPEKYTWNYFKITIINLFQFHEIFRKINNWNKNLTGETLPVPVWSKFDEDVTIVGDVVEVNDVVSMAVKDEKVLILLLRLLENVILPSEKK